MKRLPVNLSARTARLVVRPYKTTDFEAWAKGFRERLEPQNEFDQNAIAAKFLTRTSFEKMIALHKVMRDSDQLYIFAAFDRKTGAVVGHTDVLIYARLDFQWANLGYSLHNQFWGNGFAKEAAEATLQIAFKKLKLQRVEASADRKNKASLGVMKAIGMKREGVRTKSIYANKAWRDLIYYSMTAESGSSFAPAPSIGRTFLERNAQLLKLSGIEVLQ